MFCLHVYKKLPRWGSFFQASPMSVHTPCTARQSARPNAVGSATAASVQRTLRVSFQMVRQVVEHGQCATVNTSVHSAVQIVQSFASSSAEGRKVGDIRDGTVAR